MAKAPKATEPPGEPPVVPPTELYANYDIRLVMLKLGELGAQVSDLRGAVKETQETQAKINERIIRFDQTLKIGGGLILLFLGFFWFMFGGDIRALRDLAVRQQQTVTIPATPTPAEAP